VIDKLDVRVPRTTPFTKEFGHLYRELWCDPEHRPFRETEHYEVSGDLRNFGYSAILHGNCKHRPGAHKLELVDTGAMSYREMLNEVERIYDCPARTLEVMRVDMCADLPRVSVAWLQDRVRVHYKRWGARAQKIEPILMMDMGKRGIETVYFGKKPNCYRIYNKIAEFQHQYQQMQRHDEGDLPSFEQCFGYTPDFVLTRVERQIAGGRVPKNVGTMGRLQQNAVAFDPFDKLEVISGGKPEPNPTDYDLSEWLAGKQLGELCCEWGMHRLRQFINQHSMGNAGRYLRKYRDFLPPDAAEEDSRLNPTFDGFVEPEPEQAAISDWREGITQNRITEIYRESVSRQLAA
jgi:hypothetical protein